MKYNTEESNVTMANEPMATYRTSRRKRVNRTYEAMMRLKGSLILVNPQVLDL